MAVLALICCFFGCLAGYRLHLERRRQELQQKYEAEAVADWSSRPATAPEGFMSAARANNKAAGPVMVSSRCGTAAATGSGERSASSTYYGSAYYAGVIGRASAVGREPSAVSLQGDEESRAPTASVQKSRPERQKRAATRMQAAARGHAARRTVASQRAGAD